ncbi:MAG: hypothetical protein LW696_07635 [Alphaproteobacteria bacterium]|jgi:CHASE3 domain sensor protein|nr:hypothetical protein [Alphaproteobacteria bacterium]
MSRIEYEFDQEEVHNYLSGQRGFIISEKTRESYKRLMAEYRENLEKTKELEEKVYDLYFALICSLIGHLWVAV